MCMVIDEDYSEQCSDSLTGVAAVLYSELVIWHKQSCSSPAYLNIQLATEKSENLMRFASIFSSMGRNNYLSMIIF